MKYLSFSPSEIKFSVILRVTCIPKNITFYIGRSDVVTPNGLHYEYYIWDESKANFEPTPTDSWSYKGILRLLDKVCQDHPERLHVASFWDWRKCRRVLRANP